MSTIRSSWAIYPVFVSFASHRDYFLIEGKSYFCNSYAPMSHVTPCGRLTPRWSVEISLIRQALEGIRSMAALPGSKAWVWVDPLLFFNKGSIFRAARAIFQWSVPCAWLG